MSTLPRRLAHRVRAAARPASSDAGFTVLEAVVSFVLFAAVFAGATAGIVNSSQAAHTSQKRVDAANIAQQTIASVRASRMTITPGSSTLTPLSPDGKETFTVTRTIAFDDPSFTGCPSGASGAMFTVVVKVNDANSGLELARSAARVLC